MGIITSTKPGRVTMYTVVDESCLTAYRKAKGVTDTDFINIKDVPGYQVSMMCMTTSCRTSMCSLLYMPVHACVTDSCMLQYRNTC